MASPITKRFGSLISRCTNLSPLSFASRNFFRRITTDIHFPIQPLLSVRENLDDVERRNCAEYQDIHVKPSPPLSGHAFLVTTRFSSKLILLPLLIAYAPENELQNAHNPFSWLVSTADRCRGAYAREIQAGMTG